MDGTMSFKSHAYKEFERMNNKNKRSCPLEPRTAWAVDIIVEVLEVAVQKSLMTDWVFSLR